MRRIAFDYPSFFEMSTSEAVVFEKVYKMAEKTQGDFAVSLCGIG